MFDPTSAILGVAGSILYFEYRLYRINSKQESEEVVQWYRDARILCDQIERECIDLQGRAVGDFEKLVEGPMSTLDRKIQELKDHLSEAPDGLDPNLKFKLKDVWVKYAMLNVTKVTHKRIQDYPLASAKNAKSDLDEQLEEIDRGLFQRIVYNVKNSL